jgi:hypothetical protein
MRELRDAIPISSVRGKKGIMTDQSEGNKERPNVHLQGEGRPFGRALVKPTARVLKEKIVELVEPLELPMEMRWKLIEGVAIILRDYLGQVLTSQIKIDHGSSRHALKRIAIESASIAKHLNGLDNEFLFAIEQQLRGSEESSDIPDFDFLRLVPTLERLSTAADRAEQSFRPRRRGAPTRSQLDQAMHRFRELFDAVGLTVELRESGSKVNRRSVGQQGGELLLAIFREFHPLVDEAVVWGSWSRTKRQPKQKS